MEQNPSWETKISSASEEIPHILWKQKILTMFTTAHHPTICTQISRMHTLKSYFLKIHFYIIFTSIHRPSMCSVPISHKNPVWTHPQHMPHASHLSSSQITYTDNTWLYSTDHRVPYFKIIFSLLLLPST